MVRSAGQLILAIRLLHGVKEINALKSCLKRLMFDLFEIWKAIRHALLYDSH